MRPKSKVPFFLLTVLCIFSSFLFAEVVKEVDPDGTLTLESGRKVVLAGLQMDEEGISVLRVLGQKKDVRIEVAAPLTAGAKEQVFAYLQAQSLNFPARSNENPHSNEIMLNEFLIQTGAARVADAQMFSRKEKFLKLQEEAKKKGQGVWSYEGF